MTKKKKKKKKKKTTLLHIDSLHRSNLCLSDSLIRTTHMHIQTDARTDARMKTVTNYKWKHMEAFISIALSNAAIFYIN